jgi:hypothetical protein
MSLVPGITRRNSDSPCRPRVKTNVRRWAFRAEWRRDGWDLRTANKSKRFETLEDALAFVRRLQSWERTNGGTLRAEIFQRDTKSRRWRSLPELNRPEAVSGLQPAIVTARQVIGRWKNWTEGVR